MSNEMIATDQSVEEVNDENVNESGVSRRNFLQLAIAAASGLAVTSMLPPFATKAWAQATNTTGPCPPGAPLQSVMEITSNSSTKVLQAVIKVLDSPMTYLGPPNNGAAGQCTTNTGQMRYLAGYDQATPTKVWPPKTGAPLPAPTLRARVGDRVQITLLNHVDVNNFPNTLDVAERGAAACDQNKTVGPTGSVNTYPGDPSFENPPNCFHGSSSTNLHFHGSHVSPSGISDNVLLNIRPSGRVNGKPTVDEKMVKPIFDKIFANCAHGHQPLLWKDWPLEWQLYQEKLIKQYDSTAPWKGKPGLPPDQQLWPQNLKEIAAGQLPQYYVGAYPTCFTLPTWNGQSNSMGQAPGTHWYHAHKHGSTALNLANGMAGALIIEGDYDDKLKPFYTKQQVLVLQQYTAVLPLLRAANVAQASDLVSVNGQYTPVLQMNPNEMQQWRLINATYNRAVALDSPTGIKWVQTAQDGVQFDPKNYNPAVTNASFPVPASSTAPFGSLAAGNRVDLLVQAPSSPGKFNVTFGGTVLLTVDVRQDPNTPVIPNPMPFPTQQEFPPLPGFLWDLKFNDVRVKRDLHFASSPTPYPPATFPIPSTHTIDGKQYDGQIDQTMQLGGTELWTIYNDNANGAAHPFHIHVNPFQVVEIMDPKQNGGKPMQLPAPWIWWDNFAIPPGGYFKMLTKFVDFTGMFVLHCHLLDHEDRGMMQLVQVVSNMTTMQHK